MTQARPPLQFRVAIRTPAHDGEDSQLLGPEHWRVRNLEVEEELDSPYTLTALLVTEDTVLDVDRLVGGRVEVEISSDVLADERLVHGIVLHAAYVGTHSHRMFVRIVVGPALSLLSLTRRSRIFQEQSAIDIVGEVAADLFTRTGRTLVTDRLNGTYPLIDYCVQFRETDLEFFHRVLAEAGIFYVWDHEGDAERLTLLDSNESMAPLGHSAAEDRDDNAPTLVEVLTGDATTNAIGLSAFRWSREVRTARHEVAAWDWKDRPATGLVGSVEPVPPEPWELGEGYHHGLRRLIETEAGAGPHLDPTLALAERAAARSGLESGRAKGVGNVLLMTPGASFECSGHPNPHLERDFLVTRITHRADIPSADVFEGADGQEQHYTNEFDAIPLEQEYRAPKRPKPRIDGPQLATVVGPPNEEIHTDTLGRIKVWMHWDREREGERAHELTCWIRVAQLWAGPGYGTWFLPRVGMEVVVQFIDGDPDRPLVTGCVYNGQHPPPYAMPDERTKSTIKTATSPGGVAAGYNELRFEDAKGQEQIYLHAQRNLDERVGSNRSTTMGGSDKLTIKKDRTKNIEGDEEEWIQGDRTTTVGGGATTTVRGSRVVEVYCGPGTEGGPAGVDKVSVLGERQVYADERCLTEVGPARATNMEITPEEIILKATKKVEIQVGHTVLTITPDKIWAATKTAEIITTGSALKLDDNAELKSSNSTVVKQGVAALKLKNNRARLKSHGTKLEVIGNKKAVIVLEDNVDIKGKSVIVKPTEGESHLCVHKDSVTSYGLECDHEAELKFKIHATRIELN